MKIDEEVLIDPTRFRTVLEAESYSPQDLVDAWVELWVQIKMKMKRIGADWSPEEKVRAINHNVYEYRAKAEMAIAVEEEFGEYSNWIAAIPYAEFKEYKTKIGDGLDELLHLLEQ